MVFPNSNLPSGAQPWVRDVQKRVETIEKNVKANEINGTSRDVQLEASFKRLDTAINGLIAADASIQTALANAQQGIDDAADAAFAASNAANSAQNAINSITNLSVPGAGTTVNATNIIGGTLKTATSGRHTEITATQVNFFDADSNYSGHISAAADGRAATVEMMNITGTGVIAYNGGTDMYGPGSTISAGNQGNGNILLSSSGGVDVSGNLDVSGYIASSGSLSTSSNLSVSGGIYGYSNASITGTVSASSVSISGASTTTGITNNGGISSTGTISTAGGLQRTAYIGGGTTTASVNDTGTFIRTSSSARYKQDISNVEFDYNSIIALQPKLFRLKEEAEANENAIFYPGFIAEEIAGTALDAFVSYQPMPDGTKRPDGVRYAELTAALVSAVKHQDGLIQSLTARLEALESKV